MNDVTIEFAMELIGQRQHKRTIKNAIRALFADDEQPCTRSLEDIISKAKARLKIRLQTDPSDMKAEAVEFYESVIRDQGFAATKDQKYIPPPDLRYKLEAQANLTKLLGLEGQFNQSPDALAAKAREAMRQMDETTAGTSPEVEEPETA